MVFMLLSPQSNINAILWLSALNVYTYVYEYGYSNRFVAISSCLFSKGKKIVFMLSLFLLHVWKWQNKQSDGIACTESTPPEYGYLPILVLVHASMIRITTIVQHKLVSIIIITILSKFIDTYVNIYMRLCVYMNKLSIMLCCETHLNNIQLYYTIKYYNNNIFSLLSWINNK